MMACRTAAEIHEVLRAPRVGARVRIFGVPMLCIDVGAVSVRVWLEPSWASSPADRRTLRYLDVPRALATPIPEGFALCGAPNCDHAALFGDLLNTRDVGYPREAGEWVEGWVGRICPCHRVSVHVDGREFWTEAA